MNRYILQGGNLTADQLRAAHDAANASIIASGFDGMPSLCIDAYAQCRRGKDFDEKAAEAWENAEIAALRAVYPGAIAFHGGEYLTYAFIPE